MYWWNVGSIFNNAFILALQMYHKYSFITYSNEAKINIAISIRNY